MEELIQQESFNREFCDFLEYHLRKTFGKSNDKRINHLSCDGILEPFLNHQLTKKNVNDT